MGTFKMARLRRRKEGVTDLKTNKPTLFSAPDVFEDVNELDKNKGLGYLDQWMFDNIELINQYLDEEHSIADHEQMLTYFFTKPVITYTILQDYYTPNYYKIERVKELFSEGKSKICPIVGQRGSGKTSLAFWLAEQIKDIRPVFIVGAPQYMPNWCKHVFDPADAPRGSLLIMDEGAVQLPARGSAGNVWLTQHLVTLRHQNKSLLLMVQNLALADVNLSRLADIIFFKPTSRISLGMERAIIKETVKHLIPKNKNTALMWKGDEFYQFKYPLPICWDELLSKPYMKISEEDALPYGQNLYNAGYTLKKVARMLTLKGFHRHISWWGAKLEKPPSRGRIGRPRKKETNIIKSIITVD